MYRPRPAETYKYDNFNNFDKWWWNCFRKIVKFIPCLASVFRPFSSPKPQLLPIKMFIIQFLIISLQSEIAHFSTLGRITEKHKGVFNESHLSLRTYVATRSWLVTFYPAYYYFTLPLQQCRCMFVFEVIRSKQRIHAFGEYLWFFISLEDAVMYIFCHGLRRWQGSSHSLRELSISSPSTVKWRPRSVPLANEMTH